MVQFEVAEGDVGALVLGYLKDKGCYEALSAFILETRLSSGMLGPELLFLQQLVLQGRWDDAHKYLQPIKDKHTDLAKKMDFCVQRQKYLELLSWQGGGGQRLAFPPWRTSRPQEAQEHFENTELEAILAFLNTLKGLCSVTEFNSLCMFLTLEKLTDHPDYPNWTVAEGRFKCFTELRNMLWRIIPGANQPDESPAAATTAAVTFNSGLLKMLAMSLAYQAAISPDHPFSAKDDTLPARMQPKLGYIVPLKPAAATTTAAAASGGRRGRSTPEVGTEDDETMPRIVLTQPLQVMRQFDVTALTALTTVTPAATAAAAAAKAPFTSARLRTPAESSRSPAAVKADESPAATATARKSADEKPKFVQQEPRPNDIPVRSALTLDIEPMLRVSRQTAAAADTSDIPTASTAEAVAAARASSNNRSASAPPGARRPKATTEAAAVAPKAPLSWVVGTVEGAAAAAMASKPMPAALRRKMEADLQAAEDRRLQMEAAAEAQELGAQKGNSKSSKKKAKAAGGKSNKSEVPVEVKEAAPRAMPVRTASFVSNSSIKRLMSGDSISIAGSFSSAESAVRRSGNDRLSDLSKPNVGTTGEVSPAKKSNYEIKRKRSILLSPAEGGMVALVQSPNAKAMEKRRGSMDFFSSDASSGNHDPFPCSKIDRVLSADALQQQQLSRTPSLDSRLSKSGDEFSPSVKQRDLSKNSPGLSPPGTPLTSTTSSSFVTEKMLAEYTSQVIYQEDCPLRCVNFMDVDPLGAVHLALGSNAKSIYAISYKKSAVATEDHAAAADSATTYNKNISLPGGYQTNVAGTAATVRAVVRTERELTNIHKGSVYTMDYHPRLRLLVSGSNDKALRLSRPGSSGGGGGEVSEALKGHTGTIRVARFLMAENAAGGDGENAGFIASGGAGDCMARLWDVQRGECVRQFKENSNVPIHSLVWLDKNIFIVGCENGRIYGHDLRAAMPAWNYSLNDKLMSSSFADKQFIRRGVTCLSLLNSFTTTMQQSNSVRPVAAGFTEGFLTIFNAVNGQIYSHSRPHQDDVRSLSVLELKQTKRQLESGEQKFKLLTASYDGTAALHTMRQNRGSLLFEFLPNPKILRGHGDKVLSATALPLSVSTHSTCPDIVTTGADGKAMLWTAAKTTS